MLHGDEVWCQLFSEPAAGSDLAAVQTRAKQNGDGAGWVLNGQKVWTTNAQFAAYGLLLARTDADVPKHKGLTMFIVPMDAPGVTIRGLRQISGEAEFNEVFFDDVRLDGDAVVGGVGNGWGTALTVLMFERLTIGFGSQSFGNPARIAETLRADDAARRDSDVRQRFGDIQTEFMAVQFNGYRALTALSRGQIPGPEAGLAKVTMVNAAIAAGDLMADILGPEALATDSDWSYIISFMPGLKSAGGTEQILRNTIGERVLGLPPEPRLDKGIPFSELRSKEREAVAG
jgi:alkylation response protein AidB-like acyl-CoA dehydrogenase